MFENFKIWWKKETEKELVKITYPNKWKVSKVAGIIALIGFIGFIVIIFTAPKTATPNPTTIIYRTIEPFYTLYLVCMLIGIIFVAIFFVLMYSSEETFDKEKLYKKKEEKKKQDENNG